MPRVFHYKGYLQVGFVAFAIGVLAIVAILTLGQFQGLAFTGLALIAAYLFAGGFIWLLRYLCQFIEVAPDGVRQGKVFQTEFIPTAEWVEIRVDRPYALRPKVRRVQIVGVKGRIVFYNSIDRCEQLVREITRLAPQLSIRASILSLKPAHPWA